MINHEEAIKEEVIKEEAINAEVTDRELNQVFGGSGPLAHGSYLTCSYCGKHVVSDGNISADTALARHLKGAHGIQKRR